MIKKLYYILVLIIVVVIIILAIQIGLLLDSVSLNSSNNSINWNNGYSIVNTILPVITAFLLVVTFFIQRLQLKEQQRQTKAALNQSEKAEVANNLKEVEDRFFTFLTIHRENVKELQINDHYGKAAFTPILKNFEAIYDIVEKNFAVYEQEKKVTAGITIAQKIKIAYLVIFFGYDGPNESRLLKSALSECDNLITIPDLTFSQLLLNSFKNYYIKAPGYQSMLSNYFRHLFHTVTYINDQISLSGTNKHFYIKRLRGQFQIMKLQFCF